MTKNIMIIMIIAILLATLISCNNHVSANSSTPTDIGTTKDFPEIKDTDIRDFYRAEVSKRISSDEPFIHENEATYYLEQGYQIADKDSGLIVRNLPEYYTYSKYNYPIVIKLAYSSEILVVYTINGDIISRPPSYRTNCYGNIHFGYEDNQQKKSFNFIDSNLEYTIVYSSEDAKLIAFQFGQQIAEIEMHGSYCGESYWFGHLFRDGNSVYAVKFENNEFISVQIATGVKQIIESNYRYDSDAWSQPLFLMEDGSIKAFVAWDEYSEDKYLLDPIYEGGY